MNPTKNRRVVLLLYNARSDAFSAQELIDRQLKYISTQQALTENFQAPIILASGFQDVKPPPRELCEFIAVTRNDTNPLIFLVRSLSSLFKLRVNSGAYFFVAGNPLQPLAISMVLKVLFRGSALQVSIHNDLSSWFSPGLLNVLKRSFFRLCIPNVDLFRFVSNSQKNSAEKLFRLSGKRSVVCPIPLARPNYTHKVRTRVEKVLGFVGRIHEERGVLEWIAVAKNLPEFQTLVVGDGPLLGTFKSELSNATFLGKCSNKQTLETYKSFSVLLSCAPYESYGLTIREALLAGVPVVTRSTVGVQDLLELFPGIIKSYQSVDDAVDRIRELSISADQSQFEQFNEWLFRIQESDLRELVSHWR